MNCCDAFGNCNQGRNCPARCKPETTAKPSSSWRVSLRWKWVTWCFKLPGWIRIGNRILRWEKA